MECGNYNEGWRCSECGELEAESFTFGFYDQPIGKMATELKMKGARHLVGPLARLLAEALPDVEGRVVVVPVPTIKRHRKERSVAHAELVGRELARARGWEYAEVVGRVRDVVQTGKSGKVRREQVVGAFKVELPLLYQYITEGAKSQEAMFILLDDITTTGATLGECEKVLREAGVERVRRVVLAKTR